MTKPVLPISTSFSLPTIATLSSHWNYKTVTAILGLTTVRILLYRVFIHYTSVASTPGKHNLSSFPPEHLEYLKSRSELPVSGPDGSVSDQPQPLRKDPKVPFITGLSHQGKPCINELGKPMFEEYASGIIRFDTSTFTNTDIFGNVDTGKFCNIQCMDHTGIVFFKTSAALSWTDDKLDFFIANLPAEKEISVKFGTNEKNTKEIKLKIRSTARLYLYTISSNKVDQGLRYRPAHQGNPKILTPHLAQNLFSLATPFAFTLNIAGETRIDTPRKNKNKHLTIGGMEEPSIIYVLLVSNNSTLSVEEQAIALPIFVDGNEEASFSLQSLENLWVTQYEYTTGKKRPGGDLQLHLGGHQQIVYPITD